MTQTARRHSPAGESPSGEPEGASGSARPRICSHDFHAGTGADARRARGHHGSQIIQIANAARGLDAHLAAHGLPQQRHVLSGGAAGGKARGSFDEVGACTLGKQARRGPSLPGSAKLSRESLCRWRQPDD